MSVAFGDIFNLLFGIFIGMVGLFALGATWFGLSYAASEEWRWNEAKSAGLWILWLVFLAPGTWIGLNIILWSVDFIMRNVG